RATSVTISATPQNTAATYHWYAATNQVLTGATQTLTLGDAGDFTFSGTMNNVGTVVKQGIGSMTLQGANIAYAGPTTVSAGLLSLSDTKISGTITNNATLFVSNTAAAASFNAPIVNNSSASIVLSTTSANAMTGAITNSGTLNALVTGTTVATMTSPI